MTNTTQIDTVARRVVQLIEVGRDIYEATANTVNTVEAKGTDKKVWVLALIERLVKESGKVTYFVQKILRRKDK